MTEGEEKENERRQRKFLQIKSGGGGEGTEGRKTKDTVFSSNWVEGQGPFLYFSLAKCIVQSKEP